MSDSEKDLLKPEGNEAPDDALMRALGAEGVERTWSNGATPFVSEVDAGIIFHQFGLPSLIIALPTSVAKTLIEDMRQALDRLEENSGMPVLSVSEVRAAISEVGDKRSEYGDSNE